MKWITIEENLKKLKNKIWKEKFLNNFINLIFILGILSAIVIIFSHFKVVVYLKNKLLWMYGSLTVFMIIKSLMDKPSIKFVAYKGDSLGLKEKLITYVELKDKSFNYSMFDDFKENLEDELQDFNLVKKYKFSLNTRKVLVAIILLISSFGIYFLPSNIKDTAISMENVNRDIKKQIPDLDNYKKEALLNIKDQEERKEVSKVVDNLKKELKNMYDYDKALESISKAEGRICSISKQNNVKNLKEVAAIFEGTSLKNDNFVMDLKRGVLNNRSSSKNKISKEDKSKILSNLNSDKSNLNDEIKKSIKNDINKKDVKTSDIAKSIEKDKKNHDIDSNISNTKNKFLAKKEKQEIENGQGDKKSENFALGEKESMYNYGENSNIKKTQDKANGNGGSKREDNNSVGSSKTGENETIKEHANEGFIGKYNKGTDLKNSTVTSNVHSKVNSKGKIFNKDIESIIGEKGQESFMNARWNEFKKQGMNYLFKYHIPLDKEDLVIDYFKELNK